MLDELVDDAAAAGRAHDALLDRAERPAPSPSPRPLAVLLTMLEGRVGAAAYALSRVGARDYEARLLTGEVGFGESFAGALEQLLAELAGIKRANTSAEPRR